MVQGATNKVFMKDLAAHDWYRFVLSFPPHLVRQYLEKFGVREGVRVLDPFCGTGTTLVECKKLGVESVGVEAHPMTHLASSVKVDWSPDPDRLLDRARAVAAAAREELESVGIDDDQLYDPSSLFGTWNGDGLRELPIESQKMLLKGSISPLPLHKTLVLLDHLQRNTEDGYERHSVLYR